jgi:hypothetical protein
MPPRLLPAGFGEPREPVETSQYQQKRPPRQGANKDDSADSLVRSSIFRLLFW